MVEGGGESQRTIIELPGWNSDLEEAVRTFDKNDRSRERLWQWLQGLRNNARDMDRRLEARIGLSPNDPAVTGLTVLDWPESERRSH